MNQFLCVEEARQRILKRLTTLGVERVFLAQAPGRILAEPVTAPSDTPRFNHSSRDGFSFCFHDLSDDGSTLELVGFSAAGAPSEQKIGAGQAVRITTGAPLPAGCDTVVMQEYCSVDEDTNTLTLDDAGAVQPGQWVREVGEDMAAGELILEPGMRLGGADIGLLAGFGRPMVNVRRKPRVAIVSTGDELVDPGTPPGPAQIVNSNAYLLAALLEEHGAMAQILPIAPDNKDAIRQAFIGAIDSADLVLSSGGVSVGALDLTRAIVDELTGGMDFWKIRIKPGKPLAFGIAQPDTNPTPILGLPGNPNACFVGFHQFVRPALDMLSATLSAQKTDPSARFPSIRARLATPVKTTARRRVYLSGHLHQAGAGATDSLPIFEPAPNQNSGNLRLFCQANAFGIVDEGSSELSAGDEIRVEHI